MTMMRWDPFKEMMSLRQAMDRLFEDSFVRRPHWWPALAEGALPLSLEMYQTASDVVVKAAVPGVKPEEVDISITGDTLTIKGERKEEKEVKEENYFLKEHVYGSYNRTIILPAPVQADKAEAVFENGILTLTLPKKEEVKPKQVKIKPKASIEGAKAEKKTKG
ncbi:MAG: Hsp20/alpha crystallin family protein [Chloroflexi bacterium]|nr:Hsp20/alpha crystallin family protein [Chloroflexota bacterium]